MAKEIDFVAEFVDEQKTDSVQRNKEIENVQNEVYFELGEVGA